MNILKFNIESWWSILKNLNNDIKLELASRLIDSIKKPIPPFEENDDWKKLAGAWNNMEQSPEELADFIRNSRFTNRQIEPFD